MDDQNEKKPAGAQSPPDASRDEMERKIDRNLEDSFPASDPPEWVLGVEREDKHPPGGDRA
jgi:hypothetical protein